MISVNLVFGMEKWVYTQSDSVRLGFGLGLGWVGLVFGLVCGIGFGLGLGSGFRLGLD